MDRLKDIDYLREHDLTVEEVKARAVFEHLTDEQAKEVIATLKTFTKIVYDHFKKGKQKSLKIRHFFVLLS